MEEGSSRFRGNERGGIMNRIEMFVTCQEIDWYRWTLDINDKNNGCVVVQPVIYTRNSLSKSWHWGILLMFVSTFWFWLTLAIREQTWDTCAFVCACHVQFAKYLLWQWMYWSNLTMIIEVWTVFVFLSVLWFQHVTHMKGTLWIRIVAPLCR